MLVTITIAQLYGTEYFPITISLSPPRIHLGHFHIIRNKTSNYFRISANFPLNIQTSTAYQLFRHYRLHKYISSIYQFTSNICICLDFLQFIHQTQVNDGHTQLMESISMMYEFIFMILIEWNGHFYCHMDVVWNVVQASSEIKQSETQSRFARLSEEALFPNWRRYSQILLSEWLRYVTWQCPYK